MKIVIELKSLNKKLKMSESKNDDEKLSSPEFMRLKVKIMSSHLIISSCFTVETLFKCLISCFWHWRLPQRRAARPVSCLNTYSETDSWFESLSCVWAGSYLSFQTSACVNFSLLFSSNQDHFIPPMTTGADFVMFTGILLFKVMQIKIL